MDTGIAPATTSPPPIPSTTRNDTCKESSLITPISAVYRAWVSPAW